MSNGSSSDSFNVSIVEGGNVVLRQSHKSHSFGKLYYACPRSKIKILKARLAMEKNPDDHPCESAAILHELLNKMENLRVE
ncbi:hypothetical protein Tco_0405556 [Tanacetum coccineum]